MKKQLKCPYKDINDLLTERAFIKLCSKNKVDIRKEDLVFYKEKSLLLPCVLSPQPLYSRHQLYLVRLLKTKLTLRVKNQALFTIKGITNLNRIYNDKYLRFLDEEVVNFYTFVNVLIFIEILFSEHNKSLDDLYKKYIKEDFLEPKTIPTEVRRISRSNIGIWVKKAEKLLRENNIDVPYIEGYVFKYLASGSFDYFGNSRDATKIYLSKVTPEDLYFAEEFYRVAYILNWFLTLLNEYRPSIKQQIISFDRYKMCPFCQKRYLPIRKDQKTCGADSCHKSRISQLKKERNYK